MKNFSFGVYALLLVFIGLVSNAQKTSAAQSTVDNKKQDMSFPSASPFSNNKITYKIIPAANKNWCCDILVDGKMLIHQPSAAVFPGNEGFNTKAAAQIVADLVIQKIKNGEMPPNITKEEMQKIGSF